MAGQRSKKDESNPNGNDYQLYTLLFCVAKLRQHPGLIKEYEIGGGGAKYGALDDAVIKVVSTNGQQVTSAIQIKYVRSKRRKMIDASYLRDGHKTSITKYFESFLEIKKNISVERIGQLILWTNMKLANNVREWFERLESDSQEIDVLGEGNADVPYQRYKLTEAMGKEFMQEYLKRPHRLTVLIKQLIDSMFNKNVWIMKGVAKEHYRVVTQEIIECKGDDCKFKESFITGQMLSEETKCFRDCFERVMKERFEIEKYGEFYMADLNCDSYKAYFKLRVDTLFKDENCSEVQWKWTDVPTENDFEEFFKRFVFYLEVPSLEQLKIYIATKMGNVAQWFSLIRSCALDKMVSSDFIDKFFNLLTLRKIMDCGPYFQLQFKDLNALEKKVDMFFTDKSDTFLCIKASQNVDCTVSRLIHVVEKELEPKSDRYLVLNYKTYNRKYAELEAILKDPKLIEIGVVCIIITCVSSNKLKEICHKLTALKVIFVGDDLVCDFDDKFNVGSIDEDNKTKIEDTDIKLSSLQSATAKDIFSDYLFGKDYYQLVLEFYRTEQNKPIEISTNELEMDPLYRPRLVERIDENGKLVGCDLLKETKFHRFIISDEPGMGKSTELTRIAVELRRSNPDYLIVLLDCKLVASKWNGSMEKTVYDSLTFKNDFDNVLVDKMFQIGKIMLLMDGYDEVISTNHSKLENMLFAISTNEVYQPIRFYIATRPNCVDRIKKNLADCFECHLKPFSDTDQEEYLKSFWNCYQLNNAVQRSIVESNTRSIVNTFRALLEKNHSVIGIPLQTYMIALLYKDRIAAVGLELPKPNQMSSIYAEFVEFMFMECAKRNYDMTSAAQESFIENERSAFLQGHIQIAQAIVGGDSLKALELCTKFQHYGIVRVYPSVGFIYQTYLEYFLSAVNREDHIRCERMPMKPVKSARLESVREPQK